MRVSELVDIRIYIITKSIQYNDLLTTPHGGFSVTIQLREITMVSEKTKISSKTLYYVCMYVCMNKFKTRTPSKGLI